MSKAIEIITSVQRRRRWTAVEKERLVAASLEPGNAVSAIARQAGIHPSQLYGWRRQLCARPQAAAEFAAVRIGDGAAPSGLPATGTIEIELGNGWRMRVTGSADASLVKAMMGVLARARQRR